MTSIDAKLGQKAQRLVLWSLNEEKDKGAILAALELAIDPHIATHSLMRDLTFRTAQLLLADGQSHL